MRHTAGQGQELTIDYLSHRLTQFSDLNNMRAKRGGIDFDQLSSVIGVNVVTLRKIVNIEECNPTKDTLEKILDSLGEKMVAIKCVEAKEHTLH